MRGIRLLYKIWTRWNKKLFRQAHKVYTLGSGMQILLSKYVEKEKIKVIPNWTGFTQLKAIRKEENLFIRENNLHGKFIVQYSGNIGVTHNVESLVELAKEMQDEPDVLFLIIGRGDRYHHIENLIKKYQLDNCELMPFQSDNMLNYSLSAADLGVIILDDQTAHVSVPSKIYNLLAVGLPLMTIASNYSELAELVHQWENGKSFEKDQTEDMIHFIKKLKMSQELHARFARNSKIASQRYTIKNAKLYLDSYLEKEEVTV